MNNNKNNISIFNKYVIIAIMVLFVSVLGATYAYFYATRSNNNTITGNATMVNLSLNVRKIVPIDNNNDTGVIVPQRSAALASALKSGCVDSNKNIVCQVYNIYIKNNSTANVILDGKIYFYGDEQSKVNINNNMPNLKWKLVDSVDEENIVNSSLGNASINNASSSGGFITNELTLSSNEEKNYYIIVWVNETNNGQVDANSSFFGQVDFISSNGSGLTASFEGY